MTKIYDALRQAEAAKATQAKSPATTEALAPSPPVADPQTSARADELDRLRGIVLGSAASDFDRAVRRVEERIVAEGETLRAQIAKFEQRIDERVEEVDSRSTEAQAELREQILSHSNQLGDRIKERSAESVRLLNEGLDELRKTKMDDTEFSKFVRALAGHLGDKKS